MPTAQPLRTGDPQRLGEYELSGRLGEGGQGAVFLGSRSGETYAVKLLHGPVGDERAAFLREVELAKHVARFCTAQVIDAGFDEGRPYIVSEYVDGPSLAREVALTGPRRGGALERLAVSTATAITAIHRAGIVHRDFKPQNVLLGSDGPRVIDFGLAKALDAAATVSGRGVGTPAYMAPEQITASAVTGKADVFSWGATMCFAANATAPFGQDSVAPVLHRILTASPELGLLEGRLRRLVESCLEKDARNRPGSRELLFELLGESDQLPAEVLGTPPPHILRLTPPLVPEPRTPPMAEPEATGVPGGYVLPGGTAGDDRPSGPVTASDPGQTPSPSASGSGGDGVRTVDSDDMGRRGWPRAAVAVSAALLVTAAVLSAVIVPTLNRDEPVSPVARPAPPAQSLPETSKPAAEKSSPAKPKETQEASKPPVDPTVPRPVTVPVPELVGLDRAKAIKAIKQAGLVAGPVTQADSPQKIGQVLSSKPASGVGVPKGSTVSLQVSAGLAVPSVVGLQRKAAESALTGAGLAVGTVTRACSDQPNGRVLGTQPQAGKRVAGGTAVALTVARKGAAVPSVVGRPQEDGRAALVAAGFTVRSQGQVVEDESRVGMILSQSVQPGTCAQRGVAIVIVVGLEGQSGSDPGEPSVTPTGPISGE
ncbi:PASTA domain-containing protein [Nonomuraea turkmeniaca]|uniref:non-specific serine/threonine protein kinase n=1 Tax=Nonomuraea turkmeniaca TaxID=103838 RepID=A0A5S4EVR3_9ACTN|nr:PASTA domain-containing protein [Nonomuraea turkmeniaca]TMR07564.1 PASTA domain-containing protein [Nonomuraea turkmeniaca]